MHANISADNTNAYKIDAGLTARDTANNGVNVIPIIAAYNINITAPVTGFNENARTWAQMEKAKPPNNNT